MDVGGDDYARAVVLTEQALAAADEPASLDLRLRLCAERATHLRVLGRARQAERVIREMLALAGPTATHRPATWAAAAAFHFLVGRWADAMAAAAAALDLVRGGSPEADSGSSQADGASSVAHGLRALISGHRGDRTALDTHLAAARKLATSPAAGCADTEFLLLARALAEEQADRPDRAAGVLAEVLRPAFIPGAVGRHNCLPGLVRLALAAGDSDLARAAGRACFDLAERDPAPDRTAAAHRCRGLLDGDSVELRSAADHYRAMRQLPDLAATLEDLAVCCADRGDRPAARAAYREAVKGYRALGAVWDIDRARARLGRRRIAGAPGGIAGGDPN